MATKNLRFDLIVIGTDFIHSLDSSGAMYRKISERCARLASNPTAIPFSLRPSDQVTVIVETKTQTEELTGLLEKFASSLNQEILNLTARRQNVIDETKRILEGSFGQAHMGNNLASRAVDIQELTAKIEQTNMILSDLRARIELAGV